MENLLQLTTNSRATYWVNVPHIVTLTPLGGAPGSRITLVTGDTQEVVETPEQIAKMAFAQRVRAKGQV
jgi:hypothetical protein